MRDAILAWVVPIAALAGWLFYTGHSTAGAWCIVLLFCTSISRKERP